MSTSDPLETPYSSMTEADEAWANFIGDYNPDGGGGGGGDGGDDHHGFGGEDQTPRSAMLDGSLSMPSEVVQGAAFEATGTVRNTGDTPVAGVIALVVATPDRSEPLTALTRTQEANLEPGQSRDLQFQVQRGVLDVEPSSREFGIYAATNPAEATGLVAQTTAEVLPPDAEGRPGEGEGERHADDPEWGEPQHVQELPHGWHLYVQEHLQEDRQRFFVAGRNQHGETIYLDKDGSISQDPVFYDDLDAVAAALQKFAEKMENGEIPEDQRPTGERPPADQVARETAAAGSSGVLSRALQGRSRFVVYALVLVGAYAAWKWRQGELGEVPVLGRLEGGI